MDAGAVSDHSSAQSHAQPRAEMCQTAREERGWQLCHAQVSRALLNGTMQSLPQPRHSSLTSTSPKMLQISAELLLQLGSMEPGRLSLG